MHNILVTCMSAKSLMHIQYWSLACQHKRRWVLKYQHSKSFPSKQLQEQLFAMNSASTTNTESIISSERMSVHSRRVCVKVCVEVAKYLNFYSKNNFFFVFGILKSWARENVQLYCLYFRINWTVNLITYPRPKTELNLLQQRRCQLFMLLY